MAALLTVDRVSLAATVGQAWILQDISLQVAPGEFVGLVGPSGAGKSSFLKLLNRLHSPTSGAIYWQGQSIAAIAPVDLRRQIVLVEQETRLLDMTMTQALHYPLVLQKMPVAQRQERILSWLQRLQLPQDWLDKTEMELSGGQQQQIAIARALVLNPTVLLLDEPTSAQDLGTATHLLTVLQDQVRQTGMSILMANHQLELMERVCDRVLYLQAGQLVWDQRSTAIDWPLLRQSLLDAKTQDLDEWELSDL